MKILNTTGPIGQSEKRSVVEVAGQLAEVGAQLARQRVHRERAEQRLTVMRLRERALAATLEELEAEILSLLAHPIH